MSLRAALTKRRPPVGIFWPSGHDPDYERHFYNTPRPPMQKRLVPDGAPEHPILGGGYKQRVPLPIFKRRPARYS